GHLDPGVETHTADLAQGRVRLLRRDGVHTRAHTAALGRPGKTGGLRLLLLPLPALADKLLDGWHCAPIGWTAHNSRGPILESLLCRERQTALARAPLRQGAQAPKTDSMAPRLVVSNRILQVLCCAVLGTQYLVLGTWRVPRNPTANRVRRPHPGLAGLRADPRSWRWSSAPSSSSWSPPSLLS